MKSSAKPKRASFEEHEALLAELAHLRQRELQMHSEELQTEHDKAARLSGTISEQSWVRFDHQRKSGKLLGEPFEKVQGRLDSISKHPQRQ